MNEYFLRTVDTKTEKGNVLRRYLCGGCRAQLGTTVHDGDGCLDQTSVMKNGYIPYYCPDCGARVLSGVGCEDARFGHCEDTR